MNGEIDIIPSMQGKVDVALRRAFSRRLRALRIRAGYETARQLAADMGEQENTYTRWERGETEPGIAQIMRLCLLLRVTPNDLLLRTNNDTR